MSDKTRFMNITFVSGKKQKFEFEPLSDDVTTTATRLEKMLASGYLIMQCEDRMHFFPFANIESIEVSPAPGKLPGFVMRAVRDLG
jgi:hypothetical protein